MARPVNEQEVADEEAAYTDVVTGVRNRRYFDERLRTHHVSGGVAIVDLDDFKMVNDAYGHRVGDLVLGVVAAVIRDNIHSTDLLVRYDCDEFEVVMPDIAPMILLGVCTMCRRPFALLLYRGMRRSTYRPVRAAFV